MSEEVRKREMHPALPWGAVAIVGTLAAIYFCGGNSGGSSSDIGKIVTAKIACHDWVKDQLKAPATADFTDDDEPAVDGIYYTFTGSVDAQNSFGAQLRSRWTCKVQDIGNDFTKVSVTVG
jgi:hypothetical protein